MIRCDSCHHLNDEGSVFCASCHHFLAWEASAGVAGRDDGEQAQAPAPDTEVVEPPPDPTPAGGLVAAIEASGDLVDRRGRSDLSDRLTSVRSFVAEQTVTVAV